jgi:small subunit ribosomal protein S1
MSFQQDRFQSEEIEEAHWTQLLDEYDYSRPQRGELREGLVMQVEENGVLVSIGTKREGLIPLQDIRQMEEGFLDDLNVGDTIQVYVQDPENKEGDLILSLSMVQVAKDWETAMQMFHEGSIVRCKVVGFNKGGLLVQFNRIRGFVPASQVAQLHGRTAAEERQQALQRMVTQEIPLKVIEVDRERNRLVFSERSATQEWRKAQKQRLLTELQPGDELSGHVNQLTNFGAFIDLGGADGLAHISELSWQRVNHPREVLSPGQEVKVKVVEIDRDRERIGLSIRQLQENPWDTIDQRYSLGQLVSGPVTNVTPFGAFVQVEEAVEGLIHASELDADPQTQPGDVLQPGQDITAKVISLDRQRQRMGLSLRRVAEEQDDASNGQEHDAVVEDSEATRTAEGNTEGTEGTERTNGTETIEETGATSTTTEPASTSESPATDASEPSSDDAPATPTTDPTSDDRPAESNNEESIPVATTTADPTSDDRPAESNNEESIPVATTTADPTSDDRPAESNNGDDAPVAATTTTDTTSDTESDDTPTDTSTSASTSTSTSEDDTPPPVAAEVGADGVTIEQRETSSQSL